MHSAIACPVVVGDRTLGVIEFFTKRIREADTDLLETMGTVAGNVGQFIERKGAEDELRRSEQELADFFENATVGLHWVGADGIILRANRAELELLGYSREEYVGRPIADFHADEATICDILDRLQAGEELHEYPARLRCKDGSIKDVLIDSSVLFRDEQFVHTRCFTRDVTESKRSEAALREAQRRFEAVFNQQFQFMAILAPDGTVLEANQTCFDATGFRRDQVLGKMFWETPWWDQLPNDQEKWRTLISEAQRDSRPRKRGDQLPNGGRRYPSCYGGRHGTEGRRRPVEDPGGRGPRRHRAEAARDRIEAERGKTATSGRHDSSIGVDGESGWPHLLVQPALV